MSKEDDDKAAYEAAYAELSQEAPVREIASTTAVAVRGDGEQRSLAEAMESAEDLTDLQFAMSKLFPARIDKNSVMVGRIDPSVLLAALHLMSVNEIMQADPKQSIDVNGVYMNNYVRLTIGLDGKGRIDTAELLGAAREEKKAERMLGAGGL